MGAIMKKPAPILFKLCFSSFLRFGFFGGLGFVTY